MGILGDLWGDLKRMNDTCNQAGALGREIGKQMHERGMDINDVSYDRLCEITVDNDIDYLETGAMDAVESGVEDGYDEAARQAATPLRRFFWGVF